MLAHSALAPIGLPRKGLGAAGAPEPGACMLTQRALAQDLCLPVKTPLPLGRDLREIYLTTEVSIESCGDYGVGIVMPVRVLAIFV
jgi:hypothetical protein